MTERIYLDANATTRPRPEVLDAVVEVAREHWGNASSPHTRGRDAARVLASARTDVARWLGASPNEVVFTANGSEADRLGVLGALAASRDSRHVVTSAVEHAAIHDLLGAAPRSRWGAGVEVTRVRPGEDGALRAADLAAAIRPDTGLVAVMWANNETGVLQPVSEIAAACRERGVPLLVDAVQAAGKLPVDFGALGADLLVVSAHKVYGPKGVGALLVRRGARWRAPYPASHETARRAGTEAVAAIAGFAAAGRAAAAEPPAALARVGELRDRLERVVTGALGDVRRNGTAARTPNTTNLEFAGIESDRLLAMLDRAGVDASNGSACSTGTPEPSHVLRAMGRTREQAGWAVRFSLSLTTTSEEIDRAAAVVIESVETLRERAARR